MRSLNCLHNLGRLYLINTPAHRANLMDMILILIASLILSLPDETVAHDKSEADEQLHRVVERCPGDTEVPRLKQFSKFLESEMPVVAVDSIQYGIPLRGLTVPVALKIAVEHALYPFLYGVVRHFYY